MPSRARRLARAHRIDSHAYFRAPVLSAPQCVWLARALRQTRPPDATPREQILLDRILHAADAVTAALTERNELARLKVRPALTAFNAAWTACCEILEACTRVDSPIAARAKALHGILFATGRLTFLSAPAVVAWSDADRRQRRLVAESSRAELASVVGDEIARLLETATNDLRDAAGCGPAPRRTQEPGLIAARIRAVQDAVAAYGRNLYARVDDHDPASLERFRRAVAPIDELRAAAADRASRRASKRAVPDAESRPEERPGNGPGLHPMSPT